MLYHFTKNVYLVSGYTNGCIYDLNRCKLYHINRDLKEKLILLDSGLLGDDIEDAELRDFISFFIDEKVLTLDEDYERNDIRNIAFQNSIIKFAWIEVTDQCNLACRHCYNKSDKNCNGKMTINQFKMVVDVLKKRGVSRIQFIGGEPFIDESLLKEELCYAVGKFEQIEIFTNGTLITNEWIDFFKNNHISVALSVYSYSDKEHDKVTGVKGSWEKTNTAITKLKRFDINYRVCNVLMKDVEIKEKNTDLYRLSENKDIIRMAGRGSLNLLSDDLIRKKLITKKSFMKKINASFIKRMVSGHNCFNSRIYISSNLDVFPCVMERRLKHCNIEECKDILYDELIRKMNKDNIDECKECELRYACFDCRPDSLNTDVLGKPWYCTYNPYRGTWEDEEKFIARLKKKI